MKLRWSTVIPEFQEIFLLTKHFLDPGLSIGWILGLTMGALQWQGAAQAGRRLLRAHTRIYQPSHPGPDGIERDHRGRQQHTCLRCRLWECLASGGNGEAFLRTVPSDTSLRRTCFPPPSQHAVKDRSLDPVLPEWRHIPYAVRSHATD